MKKKGWRIDLSGQKFGRLSVIKFHGNIGNKRWFDCICDCGNEKAVPAQNLTGGITKSCGCLVADKARMRHLTHGESYHSGKTKEYRTWTSMKDRCSNPKSNMYYAYGGRGIKVCDRWANSYDNFLQDMGRAPSQKHSIERIDVNGNYEPTNCRWATRLEQMNNTRRSTLATFNGRTQSLSSWCRELGLSYHKVRQRIVILKWPASKAFTL